MRIGVEVSGIGGDAGRRRSARLRQRIAAQLLARGAGRGRRTRARGRLPDGAFDTSGAIGPAPVVEDLGGDDGR